MEEGGANNEQATELHFNIASKVGAIILEPASETYFPLNLLGNNIALVQRRKVGKAKTWRLERFAAAVVQFQFNRKRCILTQKDADFRIFGKIEKRIQI